MKTFLVRRVLRAQYWIGEAYQRQDGGDGGDSGDDDVMSLIALLRLLEGRYGRLISTHV